jgi:hypothetical protein
VGLRLTLASSAQPWCILASRSEQRRGYYKVPAPQNGCLIRRRDRSARLPSFPLCTDMFVGQIGLDGILDARRSHITALHVWGHGCGGMSRASPTLQRSSLLQTLFPCAKL